MQTEGAAQDALSRDRRVVRAAGVVTIALGAAVIIVGLYTGQLAVESTDRESHSSVEFVVSVAAGILLTHTGVGILLRSLTGLILSAAVTALVGAWQAFLAWNLGLGFVLTGVAAVVAACLVVLGLTFGPLRRLRALARAQEKEAVLARTVSGTPPAAAR